MKAAGITIRPPFGSRACAAMTDSSSEVSRTGSDDRLHREGRSGSFEGVQVIFGIGRRCRVEQERDPGDARRNLLEQLQPFAGHRRLHKDKTGDVATRPPKLATKPLPTGSTTFTKMIGTVLVCCFSTAVVGVLCETMRSDCSATSSFANRCMRLRVAWCRPASVDPNVAALGPASFWSPSRKAARKT